MKKLLKPLTFTLLLSTSLSQFDSLTPSDSEPGLMIYYIKKPPTGATDFFGGIWALGLYASLIIMLIDVFFRYKGKAKRWMGVYRFVIVAYGASTPFLVGSMYDRAYRGLLDTVVRSFYTVIYLGGWESGPSIKVLPDVTNTGGQTFKRYFNYINVNFIPLVLLLILGILCIVFRRDYKEKGNNSNLIYMLMYIVIYFCIFPLVHWGFHFMKQGARIGEWNERNGTDYDRNKVHYIFAYFIMIVTFVACGLFWIRLFYMSFIAGGPLLRKMLRERAHGTRKQDKKNDKKKKEKEEQEYEEAGRRENDPRNLGQSQYISNPKNSNNNHKDKESGKNNYSKIH